MVSPSSSISSKVVLFHISSTPISAEWLEWAQQEARNGDETESQAVIESTRLNGPVGTSFESLAQYYKDHFQGNAGRLGNTTFLIADELSEATNSLVIVQLNGNWIENETQPVLEGWLRSHPYNCLSLAMIFCSDIQGIRKYAEIATEAKDHVLPSFQPPLEENNNAIEEKVIVYLGEDHMT